MGIKTIQNPYLNNFKLQTDVTWLFVNTSSNHAVPRGNDSCRASGAMGSGSLPGSFFRDEAALVSLVSLLRIIAGRSPPSLNSGNETGSPWQSQNISDSDQLGFTRQYEKGMICQCMNATQLSSAMIISRTSQHPDVLNHHSSLLRSLLQLTKVSVESMQLATEYLLWLFTSSLMTKAVEL